jgi:hypothetical protein
MLTIQVGESHAQTGASASWLNEVALLRRHGYEGGADHGALTHGLCNAPLAQVAGTDDAAEDLGPLARRNEMQSHR